MLHLCSGNQLENLADQLVLDLSKPVNNFIKSELIAVPGAGFGRWLSLRIAHQRGVCANIHWKLPADLIWFLFRTAIPDVPESNAFSSEALAWRIFDILSDNDFVKSHKPLRVYLASGGALKSWQLSKKLGHLFEQYLIYRPDWILEWQRRTPKHWQAEVWNRLVSTGINQHWLILQKEMLLLLKEDQSVLDKLPDRISFFALPTLSVVYLEFLKALSKNIDVMIYYHNFTKVYWSEIDTKTANRLPISNCNNPANNLGDDNSLLATMGRQGREQLSVLMQVEAIEKEVFLSPSTKGLLGFIQKDIFESKSLGQCGKSEIEAGDNSLQVHVCHGIMREVEVLHDQLIDILQVNRDLSTADILVLIPEVDAYASYIEAVFGSASGDRYIPWQMNQAGSSQQDPLNEVFLILLDLPLGRFEADKIMSLLEHKSIRHRFSFIEADKEQILYWIRDLRIFWGVDESEVRELDFSARYKHTWRAGTDRLLLGHAFGDTNIPFSGILPNLPLDGDKAQLVGRLMTFIEKLIALRNDLKTARSMDKWIELAYTILEEFFLFDEKDDDTDQLQGCFKNIEKVVNASKHNREVPLEVFREIIKDRASRKHGSQLISGAVTFSRLSYGQILPAEVICVLGLNDDSYPRRDSKQSFDEIRKNPRAGDRRSSDEDRHVFLEALLSARRKLYFSYVGRDVHDNMEHLPSILLCELMDYVDETYRVSGNTSINELVTTHHPLQPFSARYFNKKEVNLFSYVSDFVPPTECQKRQPRPLLPGKLPPMPDEPLALETLTYFFSNPSRMLIRDRLGIYLDRARATAGSREPVSVDKLTKYRLEKTLLQAQVQGESYETITERLHSAGDIPVGTSGDLFLEKAWQEITKVSSRLIPKLPAVDQKDIKIDVLIDDIRLQGTLENLTDDGLIDYSLYNPSPYDLLMFWIVHLTVGAFVEKPNGSSRMLVPGKDLIFSPVTDAFGLLEDLVSVYKEGMTRVLAFFPRTSWAYVTATQNQDIAAHREWHGSHYKIGEGQNPYYDLAFRDCKDKVLLGEFQQIARKVYDPLCKHLLEEEAL